jgi:hypothetical protein
MDFLVFAADHQALSQEDLVSCCYFVLFFVLFEVVYRVVGVNSTMLR